MLKRLVLLFLFLLVSRSLLAGPYDPKHQWKTVQTPHFSINFYEGEAAIVQRLIPIVEEAYTTLSKKFDARPWGRIEVVVADQQDAANAFAMPIPYNLIVLRVVAPTTDSNLADYDNWLREVFTHELTHIIHITDTRYPAKAFKLLFGKLIAPNGLAPGWVLEGLATYFETAETTRGRGRASFTEMLLRTDILRGQFLRLDEMAGSQYSWPSWMAQYLYGVAFWRYLSETYGEEKLTEFSHRYGRSLWLYSLNNKAKKSFGKSFYQLWAEWKQSLEGRYFLVKKQVEEQGLKEGEPWLEPKRGESFSTPWLTPDGKQLIYLATSIHHRQELRLRDLSGTTPEKIILKKKDAAQLTVSPDGKTVVFSKVGKYKRYYQYSDLHQINLESGKVKQLTKGKRARDPDFSPDGKQLVCVLGELGKSHLARYDLEQEKFVKEWEETELGTEYNHPRWSPDGRWIAVSVHAKGQRDLWLVEAAGAGRKRLTHNVAIEDRPSWAPDGGSLYYSSDEGGIPNLYRYELASGQHFRVTNLLSGAFAPTIASDGLVVYQQYNGSGFEIRRLKIPPSPPFSKWGDPISPPTLKKGEAGRGISDDSPLTAKKYNPFRKLFIPRYLSPNGAFIDSAIFLSVLVSNFDPIERHSWFGDGTFRSDNQFFGYDVGYSYNRFSPSLMAGNSLYSVNYGDIFGFGTDYFEKRLRSYGGVSWPLGSHRITTHYFFEDRSEESGLPAGVTLLTLGNYSGLYAQYRFSSIGKTTAAISTEEGSLLTLNSEVTNSLLGSSENLEQQVFWADGRTFISLGQHHVLAFRAAGGAAFGDRLLQGNFGLGGSVGEGPFTGTSTRVFTLRGLPLVTFSRDRVWVSSFEYRFPLFYIERGAGTLPGAVNAGHFALFADLGDAYTRNNPRSSPLLGVGAELRGEFVIGYYLPVTGRLGYGILVTNRNRIAGVTDPLTGADARNGVVVLELGTSF